MWVWQGYLVHSSDLVIPKNINSDPSEEIIGANRKGEYKRRICRI